MSHCQTLRVTQAAFVSESGSHGHRKCCKEGVVFEKITMNAIKFEPGAYILCNENIGRLVFIVYIVWMIATQGHVIWCGNC